ncbi:hypothetical protein C1646_118694 [Rhizophagus diaphanus]|nr:hypothetical protein C1646_118694 [Rhizophagus diaphanus] [Rhizophagus sp. MUCL 43196]
MKLKRAEVQFAVDQSLTGNKANSVFNEMKLSFILNQKNNAPVIGSKRTYPNEESTQSTFPNKVEYNLIFFILLIKLFVFLYHCLLKFYYQVCKTTGKQTSLKGKSIMTNNNHYSETLIFIINIMLIIEESFWKHPS